MRYDQVIANYSQQFLASVAEASKARNVFNERIEQYSVPIAPFRRSLKVKELREMGFEIKSDSITFSPSQENALFDLSASCFGLCTFSTFIAELDRIVQKRTSAKSKEDPGV